MSLSKLKLICIMYALRLKPYQIDYKWDHTEYTIVVYLLKDLVSRLAESLSLGSTNYQVAALSGVRTSTEITLIGALWRIITCYCTRYEQRCSDDDRCCSGGQELMIAFMGNSCKPYATTIPLIFDCDYDLLPMYLNKHLLLSLLCFHRVLVLVYFFNVDEASLFSVIINSP